MKLTYNEPTFQIVDSDHLNKMGVHMKSSYLAIVNDLKLLVLVGTCEVEYDVNEEERIHYLRRKV